MDSLFESWCDIDCSIKHNGEKMVMKVGIYTIPVSCLVCTKLKKKNV